MRSVKSFIAAGAAIFLSSAAFAADMAIAPPPYAAPVVEDFGGWYLRGDIGFSNQRVKTKEWVAYSSLLSLQQDNSFDTAGIFGVGVGYRFNNWFRADVIGQYRGNANLHSTDRFVFSNAGVPTAGVDTYTGSKAEVCFLNGEVVAEVCVKYIPKCFRLNAIRFFYPVVPAHL